MTEQEQRIAIAEACPGWRVADETGMSNLVHWTQNGTRMLSNPLDDLNAMHEAEKTLTHDQWRIYLGFIMGERTIPKLASMEEFHRAWNATAAQRAEAFLRTIGKWRDQ